MAQFFTNFSGYTVNQQPSDWTERWNTSVGTSLVRNSGIPSGAGVDRALEIDLSSNGRYALSWDEVGTPSGDVEVLVLAHFAHTSNVGGVLWTLLHGSGADGTENSYTSDFLFQETDETRLSKRVNGSFTSLGTSNQGMARNQWLWVRLQRISNAVHVKVWEHGTSEPGTWAISVSDTSHSSGWVGLGALNSAGVNWFAQIGVGTGGDAAPSEPLIPTVPDNFTLTTIDHESATADWDEPANTDTYDLRWDIDDLFGNPTTISDIGDPPQVVSGLPAGRTIFAKVRACNAEGCSDWSDVDSATTDPPHAEISQRVTARHSAELEDIGEITVAVSQRVTARQSVEAVPTMIGAISGTVMLSGSPVEGAVVIIQHPPESETDFDTTTTNASGEYSFDDLLVVQEGYHVAVAYRDGIGNLYNTTSLPFLTPVAE